MAGGAALVALILLLTALGQVSHPPEPGASTGPSAPNTAAAGPNIAAEPNKSAAASPGQAAPGAVQKGQELYQSQGCAGCHKISGQGGTAGSDLSNEGNSGRSADWLATQIRDPKAHNPASTMPSYTSLSPEQVGNLVAYLLSLHAGGEKPAARAPAVGEKKEAPPTPAGAERQQLPASGKQGPPGEAATLIGGVKLGRALFADYCGSCHGPAGTDKVPNPGSQKGMVPGLKPIDPNLASPDPSVFAVSIDRIIQHGSVPRGPHPAIYMPAYGDGMTLTQAQIAAVEAYILDLNGVNRAKIIHPGMAPEHFFPWTIAAFAMMVVVAVVVRLVTGSTRER